MNALIIDDEQDSREVIKAILEEYCPKVNIVGEADNAEDGYKLISSLSPDLLFLDIQMQPETGLDLLKKFDDYPFEVIFVTAWNQYAVEAIKLHALDYLLKPIDIDELMAFRKETGSIIGFPGSTTLETREAALELECDILVPAALENQITEKNAARIKAKIIGEAANGPVTYEADLILREKGVIVIPDMYINAGGVTVSYFEWLKNLSHMRFGRMEKRFNQTAYDTIGNVIENATGKRVSARDRRLLRGAEEIDLVRSGLEETMVTAYQQIRDIWAENPAIEDLRTAAFVNAIEKISSDYISLGIFP